MGAMLCAKELAGCFHTTPGFCPDPSSCPKQLPEGSGTRSRTNKSISPASPFGGAGLRQQTQE